ncbi:DUF397 domain-containing protein [Streptomyces sp. NPDC045470]|uniref:DUF397 domain-containing protein n=1 Tax=Streptomyces sp. NPDC045470 TaxID=3155469 RepID=UPI0033D842F6
MNTLDLLTGQTTGITWRKSTYSAADNECLEITASHERVTVRDSKCVDRQPLVLSRSAFADFVAGCRTGHWHTPG